MATEISPDTPFEKEPQFSSDETTNSEIKRPEHIASSGTLDKLVDAARGYAEKATADNTNKGYAADWRHFSSWCRRRGADALLPDPQLVGLYITECAVDLSRFRSVSLNGIIAIEENNYGTQTQ